MTTINADCPAIEELQKACAQAHGLYGGIGLMASAGKLREIARDFESLADQVAKSGYVPPARQAEYERHERLSRSIGDREVAAYHRQKMREIRGQLGEGGH
jgi:hypothetical protein